jgi:hypothetical protein
MTTNRPCASVAIRSMRRGKAVDFSTSAATSETRGGAAAGRVAEWARAGCKIDSCFWNGQPSGAVAYRSEKQFTGD